MRLRSCIVAWLLAGVLNALAASAADVTVTPPSKGANFTDAEVEAAVEKLNADPNLASERKTRGLRWKTKEEERKERRDIDTPAWLEWIEDLFSWLGETARVLVWVVAAVLVAILGVWFYRFVGGWQRGGAVSGATFAPTHVRDLDIRPESLPSDIGKSAMELWERGDYRAALSLLYRGLLSRMAHSYAVPIRHSSTEGECRILAVQHMPALSHDYVGKLIRTWQSAVYGNIQPQTEMVRLLCDGFAPALDRPNLGVGAVGGVAT